MFRTHYNAKEKLWTGNNLSSVYNPEISLGQIIRHALIENRSKIAQVSDECGVQMTFDEIHTKAIRAAKNLQPLGYQPGNIFGIMARNSQNVAPILFASFFIGCPTNPLNPNLNKTELIHMLKTIKPSSMFCDLDNYDLVEQCYDELGIIGNIFTFGGKKGRSRDVDSLFAEVEGEEDFLPIEVDGENHVAIIVCSSGTTGLSKGVSITHAALANAVSEIIMVDPDDVMLCFSPLYWVTGILVLLMGTFCGSKRIITTENFTPELQLRLIEDYKVTFLLSPPHYIALILASERVHKTDLSSIKYQLITGSKISQGVHDEWNKRLGGGNKSHAVYGLSEAGGFISVDYPESGKNGTIGRLVNGCSMKIVDEDGNRCGPNANGEICFKMTHKFIGYYGNESATLESIDKDGFIMSGDIGHFDDDGNLFIVDRKKDLLKCHGLVLASGDVEDFLSKHPAIDLVCVVGISDDNGSDYPAAVIIRKENSKINEQDVADIVAANFPEHYKLRGGVYFVDSFPVSASGKVLKRCLRDIVKNLYEERLGSQL